MILYASGIIFFTFFYTSITFNPNETAENLRKYGGFIPGIRPGENTAKYIEFVLIRLTTIGTIYLTFVFAPKFSCFSRIAPRERRTSENGPQHSTRLVIAVILKK